MDAKVRTPLKTQGDLRPLEAPPRQLATVRFRPKGYPEPPADTSFSSPQTRRKQGWGQDLGTPRPLSTRTDSDAVGKPVPPNDPSHQLQRGAH